jgi:hypothetical protein
MSGNIQKSSSLGQIVEDITRLKQRLEHFERHVHNIKKMKKQRRNIFEHWVRFWMQKKPFTILLKYSMIAAVNNWI